MKRIAGWAGAVAVAALAAATGVCPADDTTPSAPPMEEYLAREIDLPAGWQQGVSLETVLTAASRQVPLNFVAQVGNTHPVRLERRALRHLLARAASATWGVWYADGNTVVFRSRCNRAGVTSGLLGPTDCLAIGKGLATEQAAALRLNGYLPFTQLRPEQRDALRRLRIHATMPDSDDLPLADLPDDRLFLVYGFRLVTDIALDAQIRLRDYTYVDTLGGPAIIPAYPLQKLVPRPAPGEQPAPEPPARFAGLATPPPAATEEDPAVILEARQPPVYTLAELAKAIREQHHREVYIDEGLASDKLWVAHTHGDLTVSRLMRLMTEVYAGETAWEKVPRALVLVPFPDDSRRTTEETRRIYLGAEGPLRAGMLQVAQKLWNTDKLPPLPEDSARRGPRMRWKDLPPAWRDLLRQWLSDHRTEQTAPFLWKPNGFQDTTVRFTLEMITLVSTRDGLCTWGLVTDGMPLLSVHQRD